MVDDPDIPIYQEALRYPATIFNSADTSSYASSVQQGAVNLVAEVNYIASVCPYTNILLGGYSQGAQVIADALDPTYAPNGGISAAGRAHLTAVVLFADPSYVPNQAWDDAGNGIGQGMFHRGVNAFSSWTHLHPQSGRQETIVRSYCLSGDAFCQNQFPFGTDIHSNGYTALVTLDGWIFMRNWMISAD